MRIHAVCREVEIEREFLYWHIEISSLSTQHYNEFPETASEVLIRALGVPHN